MFDAADFGIYLDEIADDVLIFENDEEAVDEVFQQALCAEGDGDAGESGGGERGSDVKIQHLEAHQDGDDGDDRGAYAIEQAGHGASLLLAHLSGARLGFRDLHQAGGESFEQAREEEGEDKDHAEAQPGLSYNFQPP